MRRLIIIMIFLFALFDMGLSGCSSGLTYASDAKNLATELKKLNPKKKKEQLGESYLTLDLACTELMKKEGRDKSQLLDEIILLYSRIAPAHPLHHGWEHLMPYYMKNPDVVKKAVTRLLSKDDAKEFFLRLGRAVRENTEGQD